MSTGVVAASAAAVAMYWYLFKQKGLQDGTMEPALPVEACRNAPDHAPSNWGEALFHVKEVLRYMYNETLGRWHTIDLFVGLAYLSHREALEYPAADIAAKGTRVELGAGSSVNEQIKLILELQEARRYMLYCKGLKLRREEMQARFWREHLGADSLTIVKQQATAGVLRPAYVVVSDHCLRAVVLCIRGTHSMKDLFTSLAGAAKPHHVVDPSSGQLVLGYSHLGMLAAARWLARQVTPLLGAALADSPGYQLRIVGHSMGGGTAALLTMMFRGGLPGAPPGPGPSPRQGQAHVEAPTAAAAASTTSSTADPAASCPAAAATAAAASDDVSADGDPFLSARCVAIACPSVVTLELAAACRDYVTSLVNGTDIVPTFCAASVDRLREDVTRSSWFSEFSRDMRSGVVRALQGGVRGVGTATQWTSRNILQPAVVPFRACYATSTSRRSRRRAASTAAGQSTGAAAAAAVAVAATAGGPALDFVAMASAGSPSSSPSRAQLSAAEHQEQMLLAAGAGGGAAAAAAAAAAVAALEGGGVPSGALSPTTSEAVLAVWGGQGAGMQPLPPGLQSMSPATAAAAATAASRLRAGGGGGGGASGSGISGVDQRAMAEAVQSCMYAVNSAVSAHQHHQHHQHSGGEERRAPNAAIAEALGLLESLPQELGPPGAAGASAPAAAGPSSGRPAAHQHNHHGGHSSLQHQRSLEALDAPDPWRRPAAGAAVGSRSGNDNGAVTYSGASHAPSLLAADSLLGSSSAKALGAGGVSTAMVYGSSLRRRLWPWGQSQGQDGSPASGGVGAGPDEGSTSAATGSGQATGGGGGGGGLGFGVCGGGLGGAGASASGSYSSLCEQDSGGGGASGLLAPPRMSAPDSPGKAKAMAAVPGVGVSGGGVVVSSMAALASTRAIGDWLWRGGGLLFNSCTTPRRAMSAGPGGLGQACGGGGGGGGASTKPLLMDVGEGFDDESDPDPDPEEGPGGRAQRARRGGSGGGGAEDSDGGLSDGDSVGSEEAEGDVNSDDGEEDEDGEGRVGGARLSVADGGGGGGHSGTGLLSGSGASANNEQQLQAGITAVVAAVTNQASREAAEGPSALLRDENTLAAEDVLREVREADAAAAVAAGGGVRSRRRQADSLRRRDPRSGGGGGGSRPVARAGIDASAPQSEICPAGPHVALSRGALDAALEEEELPLSPTGSGVTSPVGGRADRPGLSAAEYEARLYKRRLYPAGRILHLFPGAGVSSGQQMPPTAQASGGAAAAAPGASAAAAAFTNAADTAAARVAAAQSPYVLYEVSDPQAYSRVRLCRTMVSDHLIPAYLAALDSVLAQLEERQQGAAREAWEREEQQREWQEREEQQRERRA